MLLPCVRCALQASQGLAPGCTARSKRARSGVSVASDAVWVGRRRRLRGLNVNGARGLERVASRKSSVFLEAGCLWQRPFVAHTNHSDPPTHPPPTSRQAGASQATEGNGAAGIVFLHGLSQRARAAAKDVLDLHFFATRARGRRHGRHDQQQQQQQQHHPRRTRGDRGRGRLFSRQSERGR